MMCSLKNLGPMGLSALLLTLTACGGGGGGSTTTPLNLTGAAAGAPTLRTTQLQGSSSIDGAGLRFNLDDTSGRLANATQATRVSGSFEHATSTATINDGLTTIQVVRNDDPPLTSILTEAEGQLGAAFATGTRFDHVGVYAYRDQRANNDISGVGIVGIPTNMNTVPANARATLNGDGMAFYQPAGIQDFTQGEGTARLTLDFGTQSADLDMRGPTGPTFFADQLAISDMRLNGNRYSGGTLTTSLRGTQVDLVGPDATLTNEGQLFGTDASGSGPDEAAGTFVTSGSGGTILGFYIVD